MLPAVPLRERRSDIRSHDDSVIFVRVDDHSLNDGLLNCAEVVPSRIGDLAAVEVLCLRDPRYHIVESDRRVRSLAPAQEW